MKKLLVLFFIMFLGLTVQAKSKNAWERPPGNSIADNTLQRDILFPLFASVTLVTNNCQNFTITNTHVVRKPKYEKIINGMAYASTAWTEIWTVNACGQDVLVPVKFKPDAVGMGTSYFIDPKNIKFAQ